MFGKRSRKPARAGENPYTALRQQILNLNPAEAGFAPQNSAEEPWGFVMDTGYPNGTATLVCLWDGTTSLYTSSGFGIIGGGAHQKVVDANAALFAVLPAHASDFRASDEQDLPSPLHTVMRVLTFDGQRTWAGLETDLGNRVARTAPVFYAAQAVITELRLIHEAAQR